jgi:hypothetical protein
MSNIIVDTAGKERFRAPVASMFSRSRNEPADSITVNAYSPLDLNDGQTPRTSNPQAMGPPAADSIAQSPPGPPLLSQLSPQAESLPKLSHDGLPRNGEIEETIEVIEPYRPSIASIQATNRPTPSAVLSPPENPSDLNPPPILAAPPVTATSTNTTNHTPTLRKPRLVYLLFKQTNVPDDTSNALPRKTLKGLKLPGFFELLSRKHPLVYGTASYIILLCNWRGNNRIVLNRSDSEQVWQDAKRKINGLFELAKGDRPAKETFEIWVKSGGNSQVHNDDDDDDDYDDDDSL